LEAKTALRGSLLRAISHSRQCGRSCRVTVGRPALRRTRTATCCQPSASEVPTPRRGPAYERYPLTLSGAARETWKLAWTAPVQQLTARLNRIQSLGGCRRVTASGGKRSWRACLEERPLRAHVRHSDGQHASRKRRGSERQQMRGASAPRKDALREPTPSSRIRGFFGSAPVADQ
jgi:hypothetical protein